MDKVDIIIPAYNAEKYIATAIDSIKKQSFIDWNIIIVNDASKDNSLKVIKESIKDIEEKVKIINLEENLGVANARNIGIKSSTNRYVAFLDADDVWKEHKLRNQINFMIQNDYSFTFTNYIYWKNNKYKNVKKIVKKIDYENALKNTIILTSTVIIDTKKISKELFFMPNIQSEDTATWWNVLKNVYMAYGLDEYLTVYRITKNSLSANKINNLKKTWNLYRNYEKIGKLRSVYYFINYIYNAIKKRII